MLTQINGQTVFAPSQKSATDINIEVWDNVRGLVGSGITGPDGLFVIQVSGPANVNVLEFKTLRGCKLLSNIKTLDVNKVILTINQHEYDGVVKMDNCDVLPDYYSITVSLSGRNGIGISNVEITLFEKGLSFGVVPTAINKAITDVSGRCSIKFSRRMAASGVVQFQRSVFLQAKLNADKSIFSTPILLNENHDLHVDLFDVNNDGTVVSVFESMMSGIKTIIDPFHTLAQQIVFNSALYNNVQETLDYPVDPSFLSSENGDDKGDLTFLSRAIGYDLNMIQAIVRAYQFAEETGDASWHACFFALVLKSGLDENPFFTLRRSQISSYIGDAVSMNIIPEIPVSQLNVFLDTAEKNLRDQTADTEIEGEDYTVKDIFRSIFGDYSEPEQFVLFKYIAKYINGFDTEEQTSIEDFWTSLSDEEADKLRRGLQLGMLTYFQPEMIKQLMPVTINGLSVLANKSLEFWMNLITPATPTQTQNVPNIIRSKFDTDEDAAQAYAQALKNISQDMYPLTSLNVAFSDDIIGPSLIPVSEVREKVTGFINSNPEFDLRKQSIYDIGFGNADIPPTNIELLQNVQQALAPYQRLLRLVRGNPDAVLKLVQDGRICATDIAEMSQDDFLQEYGTVLGTDSIELENFSALEVSGQSVTGRAGTSLLANAVYTAARSVAAVTSSTMVLTYSNATNPAGTNVIPIYNIPKGNEPEPTVDPNLANMFGSLSFCACEQCTSLYSPAAYLTDILNYLRKKSPTAYTELTRRRPDIPFIDLSCKNTNTVLPYIDLVIEQMELFILKTLPTTTVPYVPKSFQTQGSQMELAAQQEHVHKKVMAVTPNYIYEYADYTYYQKIYDAPTSSTYSNLTNALYPFTLPFSLPAVESRTYLGYFGYSRSELMAKFFPYDPAVTSINEFKYCSELLGLTEDQALIICGTYTLPSTGGIWLFYGFSSSTPSGIIDPSDASAPLLGGNWIDLLCSRIDLLIQQLQITYKEFLQFLTTDFLNIRRINDRDITVQAKAGAPDDTCEITKLELKFNSQADKGVFFGKLYRFVRLWRTGIMTVQEWDKLFRSLNMNWLNEGSYHVVLTELDLIVIAKAINYKRSYNLEIRQITGWWAYMDIHQYVDYNGSNELPQPSVYDQLYRNRAVLNLPLADFKDLGSKLPYQVDTIGGPYLPIHYEGYTSYIAAANKITEQELIKLLQVLTRPLSHQVYFEDLNIIYAASSLSKALGFSLDELLLIAGLNNFSLFPPSGLTPNTSPGPAAINNIYSRLNSFDLLVKNAITLKQSGFNFYEIDYLVRNSDFAGTYAPSPLDIQTFYESLRKELQKFPEYDPSDPPSPEHTTLYNNLVNTIYQFFSNEFGVTTHWVEIVLDNSSINPLPSGISDIMAFLTDARSFAYTSGLLDEANADPKLYSSYRYIYKVFYLANKLSLNNFEFAYFYRYPSAAAFDFTDLPFDTTINLAASIPYTKLLILCSWINFREEHKLIEDQLVNFIHSASTIATDPITDRYKLWFNTLNKEEWGTTLAELLQDPTTVTSIGSTIILTGLLHASFPADYDPSIPSSLVRVRNLISIAKICKQTGLKPTSLYETLKQDITLDKSHQLVVAAKGKHTEEEWASIAKPLRDVVRKQQRTALTDFVLAHPDTTTLDKKLWRTLNDMYAYFLIDLEMEACMKTSRIKQAISSVQLFVDRIQLGIETQNGNPAARITLPADFLYQWNQWRAWYSIWQPARQVFLYPENWIEPELRDDKTQFFRDMENVLLQGDVTKDRAQDAMLDYLRKLQHVAKLEPMGVYDYVDASGKKVVHVIARSFSEPHDYYSRRFVDGAWTGWERIELEIQGDHIMPVVWREKLYIIWLTFHEKQVIGNPKTIANLESASHTVWFYNDLSKANVDKSTKSGETYISQLEVSLNWTEYKDGQWQDQQIGKDKMLLDINPLLQKYFPVVFDPSLWNSTVSNPASYFSSMKNYYEYVTKQRRVSLADLIKSRIRLQMTSDSNNLYVLIQSFAKFFSENDDADNIHTFIFQGDGADPYVWDSYCGQNWPAPTGTVLLNNKIQALAYGDKLPNLPLNKINVVTQSNGTAYCYPGEFWYHPIRRRTINSSEKILNRSPYGAYKLTAVQWGPDSFLDANFFYYDNEQCFFVTQVDESVAMPFSTGTDTSLTIAGAATVGVRVYGNGGFAPIGSGGGIVFSGASTSALSTGSTVRKYKFSNHTHQHVKNFIAALNNTGIDGFMNLATQISTDRMNFSGNYSPTVLVHSMYPTDQIDFSYDGAYSIYNWELFFHTPLLIAKRLSGNQQFEEARKWFHYIFDPTASTDAFGSVTGDKNRFWRFKPFYDEASVVVTTLNDLMNEINRNNAVAIQQVNMWMNNPFKPHVIARMRILAYMKNVVMCYLDNLIAWGDKLYRQDTIESINQATQLYILASNILGERPKEIPKRANSGPRNFDELWIAGLDAFSNARVSIENFIDPNSSNISIGVGASNSPDIEVSKMFYFCLPNNPKLLAYWDIIASRLFNIRNCRNIDGQVRDLPLFEPPIDPALLVRAAAAGLDASSLLDSLSTPAMPYRFAVILQKANELCNDVKSLSAAFLSALEKKDAEELMLIRQSQELAVLDSITAMKQAQIDEATANIDALVKSKDVVQARYAYYSTRQYKNARENAHLSLLDMAQFHQNNASTLQAIASAVSIIPEFNTQAPFAIGPSFGGRELSAVFSTLSIAKAQKAAQRSAEASKTITEAGYERRMDDWTFQADSAMREMAQIDKQIIGAQIRKSIAEKDLATHKLQIENAKAIDAYMHTKFTRVELYAWMVSQISSTYFQSYQFAYDVAKRAEKCLNFEVPRITAPGGGSFIKFGYWDSMRKGLISGDKLQYDLRKMEVAYMEANARELELTKHVSLAMEDPEQLIRLRDTGTCTIHCTRDMYNLDYPGHLYRRIKSVSISIPCVAGPYTTIAARLTQSGSYIDTAYTGSGSGVYTSYGPVSSPTTAISTSGAQNDSGMFELNFRDERYLPFEGTGAVCDFTLSLMDETLLRQFDYTSIADVVLHIRYTAIFDGTVESLVKADLNNRINSLAGSAVDLPRYFSVKHEFAASWYKYENSLAMGDTGAMLEMVWKNDNFPYLCKGKKIDVKRWEVYFNTKVTPSSTSLDFHLSYNDSSGGTSRIDAIPGSTVGWRQLPLSLAPHAEILPGSPVSFAFKITGVSSTTDSLSLDQYFNDIYIVAIYNLETI